MTEMGAFISGCGGTELSAAERDFFGRTRPWGLILFARNINDPEQVRRLVADFREAVGRPQAPVLIDQEGGRVQRLRPPHWHAWPPAMRFAELFGKNRIKALRAARLVTWLLGRELAGLGINVDCLPVLDVPVPGSHEIIGDRAYGHDPLVVAALGRAAMEGLRAAGVAPVIKHVPGHGRARADSHLELPFVDTPLEELRRTDFVPFAACADAPMAMTAHVVYADIDPEAPATHSTRVIGEVIRGEIGFDGLLMSDDVNMKALKGSLAERCERALTAGCDIVLHCSGVLEEMKEVAAAAGVLAGRARERAVAAERAMGAPAVVTPDEDEAFALLSTLSGDETV